MVPATFRSRLLECVSSLSGLSHCTLLSIWKDVKWLMDQRKRVKCRDVGVNWCFKCKLWAVWFSAAN